MSKSKSTKDHKKRLASYKIKRKQDQNRVRKMLYDNYIRAQEEYLANQEAHKETEEQELDIDIGDVNIDDIKIPDSGTELSDVQVPDVIFPEEDK